MPHARLAIALPSRNVWSETFIAAQLQRLSDVRLVLSDGTPPAVANDRPILPVGSFRARMEAFAAQRFQGIGHVERLRRNTVSLLREHQVQVVLAQYGPMGAVLVPVCQAARVPLVVHFHGYDAHMRRPLEKFGRYAELFKAAAALVVVSRSMEEQLLRLGAPREKVYYNCYGIDLERFRSGDPGTAPPHFLGVGRFVDKKAPHLTLLAFRKVVDARPQARLTLVGNGVLWEACRQLIEAVGLSGNVHLHGVATPDEVAALMRNSRAFVQHSVMTQEGDQEGTPLSVLEAMATGIPVVATRHAGIGDVVAHDERGLLCAERDIDTMAAHMIRLIDAPEAAAAMGRAGRGYVEQHHRVEDHIAGLQLILDRAAGFPG